MTHLRVQCAANDAAVEYCAATNACTNGQINNVVKAAASSEQIFHESGYVNIKVERHG